MFQKGNRVNPGGKKPLTRQQKMARSLCADNADKSVKYWLRCIELATDDAPKWRHQLALTASQRLAEYGMGKPQAQEPIDLGYALGQLSEKLKQLQGIAQAETAIELGAKMMAAGEAKMIEMESGEE